MVLVAFIALFIKPMISLAQDDVMTLTREAGYEIDDSFRPKASIIIEAEEGQILWGDNIDTPLSIASITKVMTAYLAFEAIEKGAFTLETLVPVDQTIVDISNIYSLSNNKMVLGVEYSIADILTLMLIPSSNAATVMMSNFISNNDEAAFIDLMNETAQKLGMKNTTYYNSSGATAASFEGHYSPKGYDPDGDNLSTPRDLAILTYHFLKKYPEVLEFTKNPTVTVLPGTEYEETFETYVFSVEGAKYGIKGMDGLKTGSSPSAGFGYIGTAKRNETRLIEVVLGVGSWENQDGEEMRHPIGNALIEKAFKDYDYKQIVDKGDELTLPQQVKVLEPLVGLVEKGNKPEFELEGTQLSLKSNRESVIANRKEKAVPVELVSKKKKEKSEAKSIKKSETKDHDQPQKLESSSFYKLKTIALSLLSFLLFLLFMVLANFIGKKKKPGAKTIFFIGIFALLACLYFMVKAILL